MVPEKATLQFSQSIWPVFCDRCTIWKIILHCAFLCQFSHNDFAIFFPAGMHIQTQCAIIEDVGVKS